MSGLCYLCLGGPAEKRVPGYTIHVCTGCWRGAEAGWPAVAEPGLLAALGRAGLLIPDRNAHGRLPRDYEPPADHAL